VTGWAGAGWAGAGGPAAGLPTAHALGRGLHRWLGWQLHRTQQRISRRRTPRAGRRGGGGGRGRRAQRSGRAAGGGAQGGRRAGAAGGLAAGRGVACSPAVCSVLRCWNALATGACGLAWPHRASLVGSSPRCPPLMPPLLRLLRNSLLPTSRMHMKSHTHPPQPPRNPTCTHHAHRFCTDWPVASQPGRD
jgi:hypothetical protein